MTTNADMTPEQAWAKVLEGSNPETPPAEAPPIEDPDNPPDTDAPGPPSPPVREPAPDPNQIAEALSQTTERLDSLIDSIERQAAERASRDAGRHDKQWWAEKLVDEHPEVEEVVRKLDELEAKQQAILDAQHESFVREELAVLDGQVKEAVEKYGVGASEVEATLKYMDSNDTIAQVLSFEEALLRNYPSLRASGTTGQPAVTSPPVRNQPTAKIVDTSSNGGQPPQKFTPGPGKDFDDIREHILNAGLASRLGKG